jgi:transcriptional regulator with XRE-family HTH domain
MLTRKQLTELRQAPFRGPSKIKLAMELAGMTQVQIAAAVGVAQSQVSQDVNGQFSEMSLHKARAYASALGCTVDDLFPVNEAVA